MLEELENRLSEVEETIGIGEDRPIDIDVEKLRSTLAKKGFNHVFKVDIEKLRKLREFVEKPDSRPMTDKISFVQCCAEITRKRAELLKEFDEHLKVVLNTDDLYNIPDYENQLKAIATDITEANRTVQQSSAEIWSFYEDYCNIMSSLEECIQQMAEKVRKAEAKHRKEDANTTDA